MTASNGVPLAGSAATDANSPAVIDPYYEHERTTGPSDEALMARAQSGDADAFGELYDRHAAQALRVARAVCFDDGRAEDAVREGFREIWASRARFRPGSGSFESWAMRIVRNWAIDSGAMLASLRQLPETQAEVIALAYIGELSHTEIAALLDLPSDAVKGRMRLGLNELRRQIGTRA